MKTLAEMAPTRSDQIVMHDTYFSLIPLHRKALLLGSGFVTKPTLQLLSDASIEVTVACRTLENAQKLCEGCKNAKAISLDVNDADALDAEVAKVDGL